MCKNDVLENNYYYFNTFIFNFKNISCFNLRCIKVYSKFNENEKKYILQLLLFQSCYKAKT